MAATNTNETVYQTKTLSKWFAISSLALAVVVAWAVLEDYDREWKQYQRQHHKIIAAIGERRLLEAKNAMDKSKLASLEQEQKQLEAGLRQITGEIDDVIKEKKDAYFKANQKYQFRNAELAAKQFRFETAIKKGKSSVLETRQDFVRLQADVRKLKEVADLAERAVLQAEAQKRDILSKQSSVSDQLRKVNADITRLEKQIAKNEMSIANALRNAPVVDFVAPTIKIQQVVLPHLKDNYFFNKVPRVDRCMTCHATADQPGFEDFPQPYRTHPNLNLYVGVDSPHPVEKVGCTTCHAGVPQSVDFTKSAHTPRDEKQAAEWADQYGWYRDKHILTPMIPVPMVEGKCIQCHAKQVHLDGAPTFNAGMRLIEKYGCYTCHAFGGHFEKLAQEKKPGPQLNQIASKVSEDWIQKWLWDPKSYRPSTLMPAYWQNHNNSDQASLDRGAVEVESISHWLVKKSKPYEPIQLASGVQGDIERGKKVVGAVGCLACHAVADFPETPITDPSQRGYRDPRVPMHGPELNQLGSKLSPEWLYSWLMNPHHYWPGTAMPSMKLTPQEAMDATAYLLSLKNPEFEGMSVPVSRAEVRDAVVREFLSSSMTPTEAQTKLASMSLEEKKMFIGEKLINHYGCYSCHAIEGFEKAPNIGPELKYEGSKDILKFSFRGTDVPVSRHDWIYTKIRTPRVWDVGKQVDFQSKTRMPHFNITPEQASAMAAIVIGYEEKNVDDEAVYTVDGRAEAIIAGQRQMYRHNCIGCHALGTVNASQGGYVLSHYSADTTLGPPLLYTQGRKTQADWLYAYLMNPDVTIRPWIEVRMPQFQMTEAESVAYTKMFAAIDNAPYPFVESHYKSLSAADTQSATQLFEKLGCLTCHAVRKPGEDLSQAAPNLNMTKARLQGAWLIDWLKNPAAIMPGTRMPALWPSTDDADPKAPLVAVPGHFGDDANQQIEAIRNYLFEYGGEPQLPSRRVDPKAR